MSYKIILPKSVIKSLDDIPSDDNKRIFNKLMQLEENPLMFGSQKLHGYEDQYRIRSGDYRIRFFLNETAKEVLILDIGHRKDIYKKK